ncbi:iron complex transport system ATP-binding protein [Rhodococcus wratislaviensis]|uniref:ABC transporter ATP-binding protein n=1 Tax=Rhodococcus wratislaviensis TaxID=44752 RepID=A0AB38FDW1_RHOWR|nr:ABC transporter ATP-binding protein [Rhodococcus wratislaviensis]REE75266.1 iron complex transport system ATP-binding protein [Rhodococcus wratislaviensis]SPZ39706.1 ABC transporter ATP-binding protein [Rhodococcus wratislaviensis]
MTLRTKNVGWSRGGHLVLDGVSLDPAAGETIGLLGPNGSGKSSLLRLLSGIAEPDTGRVLLDDTDIRTLRRRQIARRVAMVDQHSDTEVDITAGDIVRLGRIPHRGVFSGDETADAVAVERALEHTGMTSKAHRPWHTLSGGERQRAQIARALAQEPDELLLDEPTNHLDIRHQLDILSLVAELPLTSYIALHDLNLAAMFCDRVVVLEAGRIVAAGRPADVITEALVEQVYRVRAGVTIDPVTGHPTVTYRPVRSTPVSTY